MDEEPKRDYGREGMALKEGMARLGFEYSVEKCGGADGIPIYGILFRKAGILPIVADGRFCASVRSCAEMWADAAQDVIEGSAINTGVECGSIEEFLLKLAIRG